MRRLALFGALGACIVAGPPAAASADAPTVLVMVDEGQRGELCDALGVELAAHGHQVVPTDAPLGESALDRASSAQRTARQTEAAAAVWLEVGVEGGVSVRVVEARGEQVRHAPLPGTVLIDPRTFTVVTASLLDELEAPPEPVTVHIQLSVDVDAGARPVVVEATPSVTTASPVAEPAPAPAPAPDEQLVLALAEDEASAPAPRASASPEDSDGSEHPRVLVGGDFAPMLGTSAPSRGQEIRSVSLNLLGGLAYGVEGFELGAVTNITRHHVYGAQIAAGANVNLGVLEGVQLAGGGNWNSGRVDGAQVSGGVNVAGARVEGAQVTGGANIAHGDVRGVQLAGGANVATGHLRGLQLTGGVNYAGSGAGLQVGAVNLVRGALDGVQVGVVNVADDTRFSLGLVNVVREGRTHIEASADDGGFAFATLKHGGSRWHYLYSVGGHPLGGDRAWAAGLGIGAHNPLNDRLFLDLDFLAYYIGEVTEDGHGVSSSTFDNDGSGSTLSRLRLVLGVQLTERFSLLAIASYNLLTTWNREGALSFATYGETVYHQGGVDDVAVRGWPSLGLGFQIL